MSSAFRTRNRLRWRSNRSQPSTIWKINFGSRDWGAKSSNQRPKFWSLRPSSPRPAVQVADMSSSFIVKESRAKLEIWLVGEVGLEPTKAKPADLQSAPFAARDTPPDPSARRRGRKGPGEPGPLRGGLILRGALPCQPKKRPRRVRPARRLGACCAP